MKRRISWSPSIRTKFAISIMLMGALLALCVLTAAYIMTRNTSLDKYRQIVASTVQVANSFIDGDKIKEYLDSEPTEPDGPLFYADDEYYRVRDILQRLLDYNGLTYLYVYDPRFDDGLYADYVYDIDANPAPRETYAGYRWWLDEAATAQDTSVPILREILKTGEPNLNLNLSVSENGHLASAFMPVFTSDGEIVAIIGGDVTVQQVYDELNRIVLTLSGVIVFIVALSIFLYSRYISFNMIRPLQLLVESAYNFVRNHYQNGGVGLEPIVINTRDEMQRLAEAFNTMTEDITQYIKEVTLLTNEKERIAAELAVAARIQESALSHDFNISPDPNMLRLHCLMNPAKEVGGDFYDFFTLSDDSQQCFLVGDVSGKGVPAALFMMMAKSVIRDNMLRGASLSESFENANKQLCANNREGMFVTVLCVVLDTVTGDIRIMDAGHGQPIRITRNGDIAPVKTAGGFVMGGIERMRYRQREDKLAPGDTLILYTDGVTEADNSQKELFGLNRTYASVAKHRDLPLEAMLSGMREDLREFAGDAPQADDITIMAFQYKSGECESDV